MAHLGWFLHIELRGKAERISTETGIALATLRRYTAHLPNEIEGGGSGPQKIPVLLNILAALDVSPARLAVAMQYARTERAFWRLMEATLCIDTQLKLHVDTENSKVDRRLIRLDEAAVGAARSPQPVAVPYRFGRVQEKLAWFLNERLKGRFDEIYRTTGIAPATLRRYTETLGAARGRAGPQKVRVLCEIIAALNVNPAKLIVASQYSTDESSFWTLLNSGVCAEETLELHSGADGDRTGRKLYRLDEGPGPI